MHHQPIPAVIPINPAPPINVIHPPPPQNQRTSRVVEINPQRLSRIQRPSMVINTDRLSESSSKMVSYGVINPLGSRVLAGESRVVQRESTQRISPPPRISFSRPSTVITLDKKTPPKSQGSFKTIVVTHPLVTNESRVNTNINTQTNTKIHNIEHVDERIVHTHHQHQTIPHIQQPISVRESRERGHSSH